MRLSPVFILSIRNTGGACTDRLRGSTQTSTLIPDVDHAAVRKNLFCDVKVNEKVSHYAHEYLSHLVRLSSAW